MYVSIYRPTCLSKYRSPEHRESRNSEESTEGGMAIDGNVDTVVHTRPEHDLSSVFLFLPYQDM